MPGQGRPHTGLWRGLRHPIRWIGGLALTVLLLCAVAVRAEDVDVRLRIAWGGGDARRWQGTIQISSGTLSEVMPLGLEADAPGSMRHVDAVTIRVDPRTPRSYDGCDLRVQAPPDARLLVRLSAGEASQAVSDKALELPLERVIRSFVQFDLDESNNRLLAQRSPGDALRVKFERETLIFSPGETLELEVEPSQLDLTPGATYLLAASRSPARSDQQAWNQDHEVRADSTGKPSKVALRVPLPMTEGVYDVRLSLFPKRLTSSLVRGKPLATRKIQLVAVSPVKTVGSALGGWQSLLEFDPANPRWWERLARLPSWPRLPNMPHAAAAGVSSGTAGTRAHLGRTWVELAPYGWQAYPLSISSPGMPHVLEVEYPSDIEQTLGISVVEPNAAGKVGPIGLDSGIDVPPPVAGHNSQVRRHRLVFWPQTRAPYVLLVNRRDQLPALYSKIQVQAGPAELPPLVASQANPTAPGRTLAAYYDKPLVADNFSASEAVDPASGRNLDDWVTFYDAGQRLVQALQHAGFNALVLTVACEGSAIYPSRLLEPTPKYDTGLFFESGQDAVRKDVLELLFRLCDRSGIQLVPAVQFAGPLPELEALRAASGAEEVGLEPIGPDGNTWIGRHGARRGMGVYYNPLDPRVQRAMTAVVAELAERYGQHASFGGVAVHLANQTYALLPDETCSYDETTVARFMNETGIEMPRPPEGASPQEVLAMRAAFLHGEGEAAWLRWRASQLTGLYKQMQIELRQRRATARLYLTTAELLAEPRLRLALRPTLPAKDDPAAVLSLLGLELDRLAQEGIVVPRPQRIAPALSAPGQELDQHFNVDAALNTLFGAQGRAAALHFLEPAPLRLPDFDAASPFGADKTRTLLISQIVPADAAQRERFIRSLAALDAPLIMDGGWLLPLGQEAALAPLAKVYRRLPREAFATVQPLAAGDHQELVIRTLAKNGKTYFYALNPSPWPVTAQIVFQTPVPAVVQSYADERQTNSQQQEGEMIWTVAMEPLDLVGGEIASDQAKVVKWNVVPPADAAEWLGKGIQDVRLRTNALIRPRMVEPVVLVNSSFESPTTADSIPGWVAARGAGVVVEVDKTQGGVTPSSLHIVSQADAAGQAPVVWVRSEPIQPRATGRLRVVASIRIADAARQPRLRMAIEGKLDGHVYYRRANVGTKEMEQDPAVNPLSAKWMEIAFPLDDLPVSGLTDLRIGFDLMGEGEVWIDEVQVYDLWLNRHEHSELLKSIATAEFQLRAGQLGTCQSFVEGYWPSFLRRHVAVAEQGAGPPLAASVPAAPPIARSGIRNRPGLPFGSRESPGRQAASNPVPPPAEPTTWNRMRGWLPSWPKWR